MLQLVKPVRSMSRARYTVLGAVAAVFVGGGGLLTASATGSPSVSSFVPITPCRLFDTRPANVVGTRNTPLGAAATFTTAVWGTNGSCTIPSGATGLSMNVVAVNPTAASFLTVFPSDQPLPLASSLNWVAGQPPTPNAVTVSLSADGRISFYNNAGTVDLAADIVGYYLTANAGPPGPKGDTGQRGASAWDIIATGQTVTGVFAVTGHYLNGETLTMSVPLPGKAPVALTPPNVHFAPDETTITNDDDATCTGTPAVPTAPPGKVCLYYYDSGGNIAGLHGATGLYLNDRGFFVSWTMTADSNSGVFFTWAYTAP